MDFRHDADSNPALCARCKPPETRSYAAASTVAAPPVPAAMLALDVSVTAGLIIYLVLMRRMAGHPVFAFWRLRGLTCDSVSVRVLPTQP